MKEAAGLLDPCKSTPGPRAARMLKTANGALQDQKKILTSSMKQDLMTLQE